MVKDVNQPEIPDCLTNGLLQKALRNGFKRDDVVVTDAKIVIGTKSGDNYCSEIYRATVTYKTSDSAEMKIQSLIIKSMPFLSFRGPLLAELAVFEKEVEMYTKTLPKLARMLGEKALCAKCFYATSVPYQMIVFEDLREAGFIMADRNDGLDKAHCALMLKHLAKLHASSYVLGIKQPEYMEKFNFGLLKSDMDESAAVASLLNKGVTTLAEVSEKWPGYEKISNKLNGIGKDYTSKLAKKTAEQQANCTFKVLNHGDSWVNNLMFKYENGKPIDVIFVDYQMSYYSSPGLDLNYFINTSPRTEIREHEVDDILRIYYDHFSVTLKALGSTHIPNMSDVRNEIKRCEYYGLMAALVILPFVVLHEEASENSNFENLCDEQESEKHRVAMYTNHCYQNAIKPILRRFDEHQLLDEFAALSI